jgi:hypothetical protein
MTETPPTRDVMFEQLAAIEHDRWADWQAHVHDQGCQIWFEHQPNDHQSGGLVIPDFFLQRWERQIATPYAELSEAEKESDREQVARYWPLVVDFFAGWIERYEPGDPRGVAMALELRKAMR